MPQLTQQVMEDDLECAEKNQHCEASADGLFAASQQNKDSSKGAKGATKSSKGPWSTPVTPHELYWMADGPYRSTFFVPFVFQPAAAQACPSRTAETGGSLQVSHRGSLHAIRSLLAEIQLLRGTCSAFPRSLQSPRRRDTGGRDAKSHGGAPPNSETRPLSMLQIEV